jgi:citrate lyase beta subunit
MTPSLEDSLMNRVTAALGKANAAVNAEWPGEPASRQPVHTLYGGAHLFDAGSVKKIGDAALRELDRWAPDAATFAGAIGLPDHAGLAEQIHRRVKEKLAREPIEDQRIDFEDGYGNRPDAEEDRHAIAVGAELARGLERGSLAPFIGIRIKTLSDELAKRSLRTLDLVVTSMVKESGGRLPPTFLVTLPKVTSAAQVTALADVLDALESKHNLPSGSLKLELMIELTQSIFGMDGVSLLPALRRAARGRCYAAHFGTYDYTACSGITAAHQRMGHPACEFAKHMMQVAYANTGIFLSDGATNVMPVPVHRAEAGKTLTEDQMRENRDVVHRAWRLHFDDVTHSLHGGFYQGWDLHPAQLPTRYAAVYAFFLQALPAASKRLENFVSKAAQATLVGDVFDDAATGQALLNFFLRGLASGAITEQEALATGLTLAELRSRSFLQILKNRRG